MEGGGDIFVSRRAHKRKAENLGFLPLDDLNQDVLERVLAWLPTASFFRLKSVCKRWKSAADSASFRRACSQVPCRDPWFLMVDSSGGQSVVFDSSENNWKTLDQKPDAVDFVPVASSGGLICLRSPAGDFLVTNPITASSRRINSPEIDSPQIRAIAMASTPESFKLVVVSGELPDLKFRRYNSISDEWEREIPLTRKPPTQSIPGGDDECTQYFLTKCGNVVSTDIQRSPAKQYSSIILKNQNGDDILSFISSSGTVVACNLSQGQFTEYPRLLPAFSEYSIDLVECGGQMYVVLLSEFLESSSLRVWTWDEGVEFWRQVAAMPPSMAQKFDGKKADINCAGGGGGGGGGRMMVCVNSSGEDWGYYVMCDLGRNEWMELEEGKGSSEFVTCGFPFEPRIEALAD